MRWRRFILLFVVISVWSYTVASSFVVVGGGGKSLGHTYNINPSKLIANRNTKPSTYLLQHVESSATNTASNPSASTATNAEFGNNQHNMHPILMRCSSFDAAEIIQNSTTKDEGLLIITCDASGRGGGSKHDGIASILRVRNGISYFANETTSTLQSTTTNENVDLIDVIARRTIPSRTSSEVAAISLGIRRAMGIIPQTMRRNVLILSDSEFALDFYCKESDYINNNNDNSIPKRKAINNKQKKKKGRKQITASMERRDEAHRRSLIALIKDTPNRILLAKIRSSSRGIGMTSTNTNGDNKDDEDASWIGIGFIDHDGADHLSSIARSIPNSRDDEEKKQIDMSNAVKPLGESDLRWLENSESDTSDNDEGSVDGFWKTMNSMGSDARSDRKERSKRRTFEIEQMLGI